MYSSCYKQQSFIPADRLDNIKRDKYFTYERTNSISVCGTSRFRQVHFADLYTVEGFASEGHTVKSLAELLFGKPAPLADALMRLRDAVARPLGLKTAASLKAASAGGSIMFPVISKDECTMVMGENDWHLRFVVFVQKQEIAEGKARLHRSTIVHYHGWAGRVYFVPVRPVHRLILWRMTRKAQQLLGAQSVVSRHDVHQLIDPV